LSKCGRGKQKKRNDDGEKVDGRRKYTLLALQEPAFLSHNFRSR